MDPFRTNIVQIDSQAMVCPARALFFFGDTHNRGFKPCVSRAKNVQICKDVQIELKCVIYSMVTQAGKKNWISAKTFYILLRSVNKYVALLT